MAHRLLTLLDSEDHTVAHGAGAVVILPLYLGCTHYRPSKTRAQKKSWWLQPGRVQSGRCCSELSRSWRCHAGGGLVAMQGWAKYMGLFQILCLTARGRGFKDPGCVMVNLLWYSFCVLAGLSTPGSTFTLFFSWIPRFMEHTRLSALAQKTELHCLLILVIHLFKSECIKLRMRSMLFWL